MAADKKQQLVVQLEEESFHNWTLLSYAYVTALYADHENWVSDQRLDAIYYQTLFLAGH